MCQGRGGELDRATSSYKHRAKHFLLRMPGIMPPCTAFRKFNWERPTRTRKSDDLNVPLESVNILTGLSTKKVLAFVSWSRCAF